MRICIHEQSKELQIDIYCKRKDDYVMRLKRHLELFEHKLCAKRGGETFYIEASDVYYFETVDDRTFLYTANDVLEIGMRLYEIDSFLEEFGFMRISKSVIVNLNRVHSLRPQLNRTVMATMQNGERLIVSRSYIKRLRNVLKIQEGK